MKVRMVGMSARLPSQGRGRPGHLRFLIIVIVIVVFDIIDIMIIIIIINVLPGFEILLPLHIESCSWFSRRQSKIAQSARSRLSKPDSQKHLLKTWMTQNMWAFSSSKSSSFVWCHDVKICPILSFPYDWPPKRESFSQIMSGHHFFKLVQSKQLAKQDTRLEKDEK